MKLSIPITLFILFVLSISCSVQQGVDKTYVEKIVKTLSADDMQGRKVFTPGIEKAANFLAQELSVIGLDKLPGLESYQQEFTMYSLIDQVIEVEINGTALNSANVFASLDQQSIDWNENSDVTILSVGSEDGLPQVYSEASKTKSNILLLVDPVHSSLFARFKNYVERGGAKFSLGKENSIIALLTAEVPSTWSIKANSKIEEKKLANVGGVISGKRTNEIVLFSGHYDHLGIKKPIDGDSIANGANDDASGVAAVWTLAKYFKERGTPERTLYFVAFTAEEVGGFGSQYFSKQLNPDQIIAMFNLEMIGKPAVEGPNTAWVTGWDKSDFGTLLQESVDGTEYKFYEDPYPSENLFYRSDNKTLAKLGVPAHSISTTPIDVDKDYHQVTDHFETLNVDHMTNTVKAIAKGAEGIVNGKQTPTRLVLESQK